MIAAPLRRVASRAAGFTSVRARVRFFRLGYGRVAVVVIPQIGFALNQGNILATGAVHFVIAVALGVVVDIILFHGRVFFVLPSKCNGLKWNTFTVFRRLGVGVWGFGFGVLGFGLD